jgi:hypothetical protein
VSRKTLYVGPFVRLILSNTQEGIGYSQVAHLLTVLKILGVQHLALSFDHPGTIPW